MLKFKDLQFSTNIVFIRKISHTLLKFFLTHNQAFEIIKKELKINSKINLYLDCTGSLFNKYEEKQPFYYSMCLPSIPPSSKSRHVPQLSIADAILADHSTQSIKSWLESFLKLWEQHSKRTHQIQKIEVDFSWAFLHAAVEAFKKTDLKTYLQMSFEVANAEKEMSAFSFFTVVHLCSSHVIKAVCNNVSKCTRSKLIKKKFMFSFARLQNCKDLQTAAEFYYHLVIVFLSEFKSDNFNNSLNIINEQINNPGLNLKQLGTPDSTEVFNVSEFYTNFETGICRGSPYYLFFNKMHFKAEQAINNSTVNNVRNILYCPKLFDFFLNKYLALFSLWSGVHLVHNTRDTNSHEKNWFRIIKHIIFDSERYRFKDFISNFYSSLDDRIYEKVLNNVAGACLNFFQWGCTKFLFIDGNYIKDRVFCVVDFIIHFGNT